MPTIDDIIKNTANKDSDWRLPYALKPLRNSDFRKSFFASLYDAGFTDFSFCAGGSSSLLIAPTGNDKIVFRVTREGAKRPDSIPFFLAGLPIHEQIDTYHPSEKPLRLEMLLAGQGYPSEEKLEELKKEMSRAGWKMQHVDKYELEADTITITLRKKDVRTKTVPIISDPSMMQRSGMRSALPEGAENADGTLNSSVLNRCSSDYITLQDQADAYNTARENDPRLKKLIPNPVVFPDTQVIPQPPSPPLSRH